MKFLKPFLLFLIVFSSSCSVDRYLSIPYNIPADYAFSTDSTRILLLNIFDYDRLNVKNERKLDVLKDAVHASLNYAANKLKQLPGVKVITAADSVGKDMAVDSLYLLTSRYHTDYVLALNDFKAGFDSENFQSYQDNNNKKETIKTADYYMKASVDYVLVNKQGKICKQLSGGAKTFKSTEQIPGSFWAGLFSPGIKNNASAVNQTTIDATSNTLQPFFAYTNVKSRRIYSDDDLVPAVNEMMAGNYNKADTLLRPMLTNPSPDLSAKAAYDLAVLYEARGNLTEAKALAQLSLQKSDNRNARNLLADLDANPTTSP